MRISFTKCPRVYVPLNVNNQLFEVVSTVKRLGVTVTQDLKWNTHVENIVQKAVKRIYLVLKQLKRADVDPKSLIRFYCSCIRTVLEYVCQAFHTSLPQYLSDDIEHIQKRALRIIYQDLSYTGNLKRADLETLYERRTMLCEKLFSNIVSNPHHKLAELLPVENRNSYNLTHNRKFNIKRTKTNRFKNSFIMHILFLLWPLRCGRFIHYDDIASTRLHYHITPTCT